jgi:hypothetical protein
MRRLPLLVLLVWPNTPAAHPPLTGVVRDDAGPVAGAVVRLRATPAAVMTGDDGRFSLPWPGGPVRVTAAKPGYLITAVDSTESPLAVTLVRVAEEDHEAYAWVDPTPDPAQPPNCGNCHAAAHGEWSASGHARAARNPRFRNLYDGTDAAGRPDRGWNLLAELPNGAGVCAACHAPTAAPDAASDYDIRRVSGVDGRGVHCDYCHKVVGASGEPGLTHGRYLLRLARPAQGQRFFGPLDDVDRGEDVHSPFQRDSRLCAACHEGTVFGVRAYGTYSEWKGSPAGRRGVQCQDCHMAASGTHTNVAPGHGGHERSPATLADHGMFPGGQLAMLRRCLTLAVTPERAAHGVAVTVTVGIDGVGHRVPTGFPDRNLVLAVEAFDAAGHPRAAEAGPALPPAAGVDGAGRLFAKLLRDFDGRSPAPFWRADPEFADTRLTPGEADESHYRFPADAVRVRVRLLYRRFWPAVAATKAWTDNEVVITSIEREVR